MRCLGATTGLFAMLGLPAAAQPEPNLAGLREAAGILVVVAPEVTRRRCGLTPDLQRRAHAEMRRASALPIPEGNREDRPSPELSLVAGVPPPDRPYASYLVTVAVLEWPDAGACAVTLTAHLLARMDGRVIATGQPARQDVALWSTDSAWVGAAAEAPAAVLEHAGAAGRRLGAAAGARR